MVLFSGVRTSGLTCAWRAKGRCCVKREEKKETEKGRSETWTSSAHESRLQKVKGWFRGGNRSGYSGLIRPEQVRRTFFAKTPLEKACTF